LISIGKAWFEKGEGIKTKLKSALFKGYVPGCTGLRAALRQTKFRLFEQPKALGLLDLAAGSEQALPQ